MFCFVAFIVKHRVTVRIHSIPSMMSSVCYTVRTHSIPSMMSSVCYSLDYPVYNRTCTWRRTTPGCKVSSSFARRGSGRVVLCILLKNGVMPMLPRVLQTTAEGLAVNAASYRDRSPQQIAEVPGRAWRDGRHQQDARGPGRCRLDLPIRWFSDAARYRGTTLGSTSVETAA